MSQSSWFFILVFSPVSFVSILVRQMLKRYSITEALKIALLSTFSINVGAIVGTLLVNSVFCRVL